VEIAVIILKNSKTLAEIVEIHFEFSDLLFLLDNPVSYVHGW
jgi:hypothetical protein